MRPKFVFTLLLLALLIIGAAVLVKKHSANLAAPIAVTPETTTMPGADTNVAPGAAMAPAPLVSTAVPASPQAQTPEQRQAAVEAETDRLQEWSMNDDPASLSNILADLTSSEKDIRDAAIEATKQFGSTNAIPALKAAANATEDIQEKIALLEAADFLSLPSLNFDGSDTQRTPEQIQADAQRRVERDARRQAQKQKHAPSQDSSSPADPNLPGGPQN